jgi:hypothetical protein
MGPIYWTGATRHQQQDFAGALESAGQQAILWSTIMALA